MNKHRIGALIAATALTLTFAGTAFANDLHQDTPIVGTDFNGAMDCSEGWHFVHTGAKSESLPSELTATFKNAGTVKVDGYVNGNSIVMYNVYVDPSDELESASDDISNDGLLNLSHVCWTETTTTSESSTTDSSTTSQQTTDSSTTSQQTTDSSTTTTSTTTTTTTTTNPTGGLFSLPAFAIECGGFLTVTNFDLAQVDDIVITPGDLVITEDGKYPLAPDDYHAVGRIGGVPAEGAEADFTIEACPTTTTTSADETTPGGSVEELTPPSTDTIGAPTSSSSVSTSLLLVLAGVLASALVVIPAAARKRR